MAPASGSLMKGFQGMIRRSLVGAVIGLALVCAAPAFAQAAALKPEADKRIEDMSKTSAEIFARKMSEADLKEVASFFKSPVGQRYSALRREATDDLLLVLQPWTMQTSQYLFDRFSQEMRKRGHSGF